MKYARLLTAAAVLIACGCAESPTGTKYPVGVGTLPPPPPPREAVITGTVGVSPVGTFLELASGEIVDILGSEAERLAPLAGAQVEVRGFWSDDIPYDPVRPSLQAEIFLVLAVGGRPAIDGVLQEDEGRYYLRLTAGDVYWFEEWPSDFDAYLGKRIWVTGSMDDPPLTFGVIESKT
jgi:hypothetical protein